MFAFWLLFAPENGLFSGRWLVGRGSPGSLLLRGSRTSWWVGWGQCVCVSFCHWLLCLVLAFLQTRRSQEHRG